MNVQLMRYMNGGNVPLDTATNSNIVLMDDGETTLQTQINTMEKSYNNDNYIINSNFLNPVNQRQITTTSTEGEYFIDRWYVTSQNTVPVSIGANGCICPGGISQAVYGLGDYLGFPFTLSAGYSDGSIESITNVLSSTDTLAVFNEFLAFVVLQDPTTDEDIVVVTVHSKTTPQASLQWVKLERNNIATNYQVPIYSDELLKCQRYYMRYGYKNPDDQTNARIPLVLGLATSGTNGTALFFLPAPMRLETPTVVIQGEFFVQYPNDNNSMLDSAVTSVSLGYNSGNAYAVRIEFEQGYSDLTYGQAVCFYSYVGGSYIAFDAEYHN